MWYRTLLPLSAIRSEMAPAILCAPQSSDDTPPSKLGLGLHLHACVPFSTYTHDGLMHRIAIALFRMLGAWKQNAADLSDRARGSFIACVFTVQPSLRLRQPAKVGKNLWRSSLVRRTAEPQVHSTVHMSVEISQASPDES